MTKIMNDLMAGLEAYYDALDEISRGAHKTYMEYDAAHRVDHDARAAASCIYTHLVSGADRHLLDDTNILAKVIRNLKVWIFKDQDVVIRFKKMDENGFSQNLQTKQQKDYDAGRELPGLPAPPIRLTVGYLLDRTGSQYVRTQIAQPEGAGVAWCAALVPAIEQETIGAKWVDVSLRKFAV